jgi:hypothetical protein
MHGFCEPHTMPFLAAANSHHHTAFNGTTGAHFTFIAHHRLARRLPNRRSVTYEALTTVDTLSLYHSRAVHYRMLISLVTIDGFHYFRSEHSGQ